MAELPPPDPQKLLAAWMEFEKGTAMPGRVLADLKKAGLRDVLEAAAAAASSAVATSAPEAMGEPTPGS
jgi:hypothetical protein